MQLANEKSKLAIRGAGEKEGGGGGGVGTVDWLQLLLAILLLVCM